MNSKDQKEIAIDRINMAISELDNEGRFEQACIMEGRVKGLLEISFAAEIISQEENAQLWKDFAAVREKLYERFKKHL